MDLTSGCPLWPIRDGIPANYPALDRNLTCDIAILGGGMTGAFVADALCAQGLDVVLLDKRDVATGSTASCTGLIQYEIDVHLTDLISRIGANRAKRSYLASLDAVRAFPALLKRLNNACGFARSKSLYLASQKHDVVKLKREHAARRACGIDVDFLSSRDIKSRYGFTAPAALLSHDAGVIDAYALTHALLQSASKHGLRVFDRTRVTRLNPTRAGVTLHTKAGRAIRAKKLVIATGYETHRRLDDPRVTLKTTYAIASEPVTDSGNWNSQCLIWETARPYFYARTTEDRRILLGGFDDDFTHPDAHAHLLPRKSAMLVRRFKRLFPKLRLEIAYRWSGVFGESDDGLPFIGPCDRLPHAYFALGYGGNGITYSLLAAEIIRDLILHRPSPLHALFSFDR